MDMFVIRPGPAEGTGNCPICATGEPRLRVGRCDQSRPPWDEKQPRKLGVDKCTTPMYILCMSTAARNRLAALADAPYTTRDVSQITRETYRRVTSLRDRRYVDPELHRGTGRGGVSIYSWRNVLQVSLLKALAKNGMPEAFAARQAKRAVFEDGVWEKVLAGKRLAIVIRQTPYDDVHAVRAPVREYSDPSELLNPSQGGAPVKTPSVDGLDVGTFGYLTNQTIIDVNALIGIVVERALKRGK